MLVSRSLRTPRSAGIAGVVFAILLTTSLVLLRLASLPQSGGGTWFTQLELALVPHLIPFAGIAFLWLIGVVRDRIGQREDRFFATVSLGSGLLFVALLFVASGTFAGVFADVASGGTATEAWELSRKVAAAILHMYAMRMAAVFMISTVTIGLRTNALPAWLGVSGYAIALILLIGIKVTLWVELLFPCWILLLSLYILIENLREKPAFFERQTPESVLGPACTDKTVPLAKGSRITKSG